ncbi:MAG: hypothetical protein CM15mP59_4190 [Flavobacteriaceae bacterium]|nr:MAG: hypothetical protein CM15mP59_4190 [Flavobacteriaceae bacterium]
MQTNTPTIRTYAYKVWHNHFNYNHSFSLMLHFMDLTYSGSNVPQIVNLVVSAACIIIAIVSFRSANGNKLSVRQAVKAGHSNSSDLRDYSCILHAFICNVIEPDFVERLETRLQQSKWQKGFPR